LSVLNKKARDLNFSLKQKTMTISKEKLNSSVQVNFNHSKEIAYWAKKYNVTPSIFQKAFEEAGYSISKTLQLLEKRA